MKTVLFDLGGTLWAPFGSLSREEVVESAVGEAVAGLPDWCRGALPGSEPGAERQPEHGADKAGGAEPGCHLESACRLDRFARRLKSGHRAATDSRDEALKRGAFSSPVFKEITVQEQVRAAFQEIWGRDLDDPVCSFAFGHALTRYSTSYPESKDVLARLRAEFPDLTLGVVSNTSIQPEVLDHYLEECGLFEWLDFRVYSSVVGWRKPHPAIYALALAEAGAKAGEAVFVGDRVAEDVISPKRLGMRAILICRDGLPETDPGADAIVSDLTPLPEILRKLT